MFRPNMEAKRMSASAESTTFNTPFPGVDPQSERQSTTISGGMLDTGSSCLNPPSEPQPDASVSCVSRYASGEHCARQRFIVWAAVKRNRSVRMAASERLRCPLLLCAERFEDHESMLRHLTKCRHLSTGEYLCYECMQVERYNDKKCRCCLGHPSKRRRIVNMAKHFFTNIGHRPRREELGSDAQNDHVQPPPSYDSLVVDAHQQYEQQEQQQQQQQGREEAQEREQQADYQLDEHDHQGLYLELNGTEIMELDSQSVSRPVQLDAINYDAETSSAPFPIDTSQSRSPLREDIAVENPASNLVGPSLFVHPAPHRHPTQPRPSLGLDTNLDRYRNVPRSNFLSPNSSMRSRSSHGISPCTPWSAASGSSGAWTAISSAYTGTTSPTTPFSAQEHVSQEGGNLEAAQGKIDCSDACGKMSGSTSELPGDDPMSISVPRGVSDPLLFSFDPKDNYSWMSSVDTELSLGTSVNMVFTDPLPRPPEHPSAFFEPPVSGSEAQALATLAWDALQNHVSTSVERLESLQGNPLADRFRQQAPKTVALNGFSNFRRILNGSFSGDPLDWLCFIHMMYACSVAIYEDEIEARCGHFYEQAVAYQCMFGLDHSQQFTRIVEMIWHPASYDKPEGHGIPSHGRSAVSKGKETEYRPSPAAVAPQDPLLMAGLDFVDGLENFVVNVDTERPDEVLRSELFSLHMSESQYHVTPGGPLAATSDFIVRKLETMFPVEGLLQALGHVRHNANMCMISTVRKLELDLIQAGKSTLEPSVLFDRFIPEVRHYCDQIYAQPGYDPRSKYQTLGATLVEALIQNMAAQHEEPQERYSSSSGLRNDDFGLFFQPPDSPFKDHGPLDEFTMPMPTRTSAPPQSAHPVPLGEFSTAMLGTPSGSLVTPVLHTPAPGIARPPSILPPSRQPSATPNSTIIDRAQAPHAASSSSASGAQKTEAEDCCEICGYRPKGDPQWFKGSMAKHKKLQHSTEPPKIYKCPFPGCKSEYKNRHDNLRQHQIEKNHFVGDEPRRPPKKQKTRHNE
ncbi:hypothetical protein F4780DRAFT_133935 [Xylariomycetidae sp. FL0641]|nr:hypothetical protein F4780DRAFT_133935 [Xylariomycetidae sp. FL0641]